ncbi:amino acid permease [Solimonas sp. SE-A11]|uniref:amino acid permease n=1 Tax=Solimonas sp. SE-A11 TaxID=3054954 RepID=UPI00259C6BC1|nr:amino acid permease [Solimonas sp. SE-A11]MDM4771344.1 amino acid permease [Solimonas sp. SE-A11]
MSLFRTKHIVPTADTELKRCLSATDLLLLGIGCIIGTGIFVLTGITAATTSGPAIILSFVVSGLACAFAALSYSELASSYGGCGSAYGYAYASLGEFIAWIIGWDLVLEYALATATVAVGWSRYFGRGMEIVGINLPETLMKAPADGGLVNLPAVLIVLVLSVLLAVGVKESARFNSGIVFLKLFTLLVFIVVAAGKVDTANWTPFMPFGWNGVMAGAAVIFFAYIGFDAVSTAAEEARNPQRDIPIGILGSLAVCTVLYIIVSALLTGIVPYASLNTASPMADALRAHGIGWGLKLVTAGAIAGLTTVMLVLYFGLTRVFLAMSRDGLLPPVFSAVNTRTQTPVRIIMISGVGIALTAGFTPINELAELVNIGTLGAFALVCAGVIVLRKRLPNLPRPFKIPFGPVIPALGIIFCVYLMLSLPLVTWLRFGSWLLVGIAIYFLYSRSHSHLARAS